MSGWLLGALIWSALGLVWWSLSFALVAAEPRQRRAGGRPDRRRISVFKPLARGLGDEELARLEGCIESFVAELDADSELLVGVAEQDRARIAGLLEAQVARHPSADLRLVVHSEPDAYPNRKVSRLKSLARNATGELWFWSDADMQAPAGMLRALREDFAAGDAGFVTSPYIVRSAGRSTEVLDQLFVNMEFYPGVVLLRRLNLIHFAFGSGILFEAARFAQRVDWDFLGGCLADDYHLGRLLGPGRLAGMRLVTVPSARTWREAVLHYLRWHKTIRWCRPVSYAMQLTVLPLVGWLFAVVLYPAEPAAWLGLGGIVALDTAAAYALCSALGAPVPVRYAPAVAAWSGARAGAWLACWLPWPIFWRGRKWWSGHRSGAAPEALRTDGPPGAE